MRGKPIEPGCLAMIVGTRYAEVAPHMVGRVVRVVGQPTPHWIPPGASYPRFTPWSKDAWIVESTDERLLAISVVNSLTAKLVKIERNRQAVIRECYLVRLDGDETPEETHTTEQHKEQV